MNWILTWVVLCGIGTSVWMWAGEPEKEPYKDRMWLPCVDDGWEKPPPKKTHNVPIPGTLLLTGAGLALLLKRRR